MVRAPVRSIIPSLKLGSLKLGDYLSVQAHKPCSISHLNRDLAAITYCASLGNDNSRNPNMLPPLYTQVGIEHFYQVMAITLLLIFQF